MQRPCFQRLVMLGAVGLALGGVSTSVRAVTADDVVCTGCVQSSDIADNTITSADILNNSVSSADILDNTVSTADILNNTVSSADMNPNITLGTSTASGVFRVRTAADPAAYVLEANVFDGAQRVVRVGRGGGTTTNEDTDLQVIDPNFTASPTEPIMKMKASSGSLYLGSGNSTNIGESGELVITDGAGAINVWLGSSGFGYAYLGGTRSSGFLALSDGTGAWTTTANGYNGNVANQFTGNGLVKAWARINADGTVASCYRCDPAAAETQRLAQGFYEVDFTPVGTDVSSRPWTCSLGTGAEFYAKGEISCVQRAGDASSLFVAIRNSTGVGADQAYTVVLY